MYKLINKQTGEEHICQKVTIDGMDYYVSDEKPKDDDDIIYKNADNYHFASFRENYYSKRYEFCKKVIATNNPNIDVPKVVDEVERLAKLNCPSDITFENMFIRGYNKSQETHPFSEEDMVDFAEFMFSVCKEYQRGGTYVVNKPLDKSKTYTAKELLKLWKEQKPKIIYYE